MGRVSKIAVWYWMLQKRLFRKYSFWLILCMAPCLALGMRLASQEESSILRIGLYAGEEDEIGTAVVRGLMEKESIIHYEKAASVEEAENMVLQGKTDGAWIFEESMEERLKMAADGGMKKLVRVLQQEDNAQMKLARVRLYEEIYPHYVYAFYMDYIRNSLDGGEACSEEDIGKYFDNAWVEDNLFEMRYMGDAAKPTEDSSYLLAPLRGMMALWLMLVGLASAMYFLQDEKDGMFDWIPVKRRFFLICGYLLVPALDGAVIVLAALKFSGVFTAWGRELLSLALFLLMLVGFCSLLQILCGKMEWLGGCIPILLLVMLALCPIFLNIRQLHTVQMLLPPYYYLTSLYDKGRLAEMAVYTVVVYGAGWFLYRIKNRSVCPGIREK